MIKVKILTLTFLFLMTGASLLMADIIIVYVSGPCKIDKYGNDNWVSANNYIQLLEKSIIKTGEGGTIEIEINGQTIAIGENTTVSLNYIMTNMGKKKKLRWFKSFSSLFGKKGTGNTALLGVRGAKSEGREEEMDWIEDESEFEGSATKLDNAIALYSEKKYADAIQILEELLKNKPFTERRGEASFYLGSCYFEGLQYDKAAKYFADYVKNNEGAPYYEEALIKYAFSEYFQENYKEAISEFRNYAEKFKNSETTPFVLLMIGKSYKEMGQNDNARRYMNKVMNMYKGSEASAEAAAELKN